jgi:hypothetical protein
LISLVLRLRLFAARSLVGRDGVVSNSCGRTHAPSNRLVEALSIKAGEPVPGASERILPHA